MSCNPHRDVREHIPNSHSWATLTSGLCHCYNNPHLTPHPPNLHHDLSPDFLRLHDCRGETAPRVRVQGVAEACHIQIYICPLREISNLLCGKSELCDLIFQPQYCPVPVCHIAKRLDKTSSGSQHITFWQVTCVCRCVCCGEGEMCVKEVASKRGWRQGCGLSLEESSVKIPLGKTHTCHSVF